MRFDLSKNIVKTKEHHISLDKSMFSEEIGTEYMKTLFEKEHQGQLEQVQAVCFNYNPIIHPMVKAEETGGIPITAHFREINGKVCNVNSDEPVANTNVEIKNVIHNIEDGSIMVEFTYTLNGKEVEYGVPIPIEEFRTGNWAMKVYGTGVLDKAAFRQFLEERCTSEDVIHIFEYPVAGWYKDNETGLYDYITKNGSISGKISNLRIKKEAVEVYPSTDTEVDIAKKFLSVTNLTKDMSAMFVEIYALLADVYTIMDDLGYPTRFLLTLVGPRSCGKTQMALLLTQLVGRKKGMSPPFTFSSTRMALEENYELFKDSVILVDDLMPAEYSRIRSENEELFEHISRDFGGGTPRRRSSHFCGVHPPKGLAIVTAEYYCGIDSSMSRRLTLDILSDTVDKKMISKIQADIEFLPNFMWNFNKFIINEQAWLIDILRKLLDEKMTEYASLYDDLSRFGMHRACMEVGYELLSLYLRNIGVIDDIQDNTWRQYFFDYVESIIKANLESIEQNSPISFIKKVLFALYKNGKTIPICNEMQGEAYCDDNYIYLKLEWLLRYLKEESSLTGIKLPFEDVNLLKQVLKQNNMLKGCYEGHHYRYALKLPGGQKLGDNSRYYRIAIREIIDREEGI